MSQFSNFNQYYSLPQTEVHSSSNVSIIRSFTPNSAGTRTFPNSYSFSAIKLIVPRIFYCIQKFSGQILCNKSTLYGPNKKLPPLLKKKKNLDFFPQPTTCFIFVSYAITVFDLSQRVISVLQSRLAKTAHPKEEHTDRTKSQLSALV